MSAAVAYAPNRYRRVQMNTASLNYAPTKGWVCSSLKGYSLNCITFRTATDKAVTGLIQRIPQKGLISGIFANGRPTRSYFFALSPEMLNAVGCIIQRTEAVR